MHWKNKDGFSLVELAVVLTVAGIILAICVPGLTKYLSARNVHESASTLLNEMRMARARAVSNGSRNWVYTQWGGGSNQYWTGVQTLNANGSWSGITWTGPLDLSGQTRQIGANFNSYVYFYYDPYGRPYTPLNTPSSGSVKLVSTQASVTDTCTVNLGLAGSIW